MSTDSSSQPLLAFRQQIADQIRGEILSGVHPSGARLAEVQLAKRFNVSRGPIRDALLQLTQEGLLMAKTNAGVRVCHPPGENLRPLLVNVRKEIETHALELYFQSEKKPSLVPLNRNLGMLKLACKAKDMPEVVRLDMLFHRTLVELGQEPEMLSIWLPVISRIMLRYSRHAELKEVWEEHNSILQAVSDGNEEAAIAALRHHIQ